METPVSFYLPDQIPEGWEALPPLPEPLQQVGFHQPSTNILFYVSVEPEIQANNGRIFGRHLHVSIRKFPAARVSDKEIGSTLSAFFHDARPVSSQQDFESGKGWAEINNIGVMPAVRHVIKMIPKV